MGLLLPGVVVHEESVSRMLSAVEAGCRGCRTLIVRWLAEDGDPWTVVCLGGRLVQDTRRLWSGSRGPDGGASRIVVQAVLRNEFGPAVATVLGPLAAWDMAMAVDLFRVLPPLTRCEVVDHIAEAITRPREPEASGVPAGLRVVRQTREG